MIRSWVPPVVPRDFITHSMLSLLFELPTRLFQSTGWGEPTGIINQWCRHSVYGVPKWDGTSRLRIALLTARIRPLASIWFKYSGVGQRRMKRKAQFLGTGSRHRTGRNIR
jgi:hypothetical protein